MKSDNHRENSDCFSAVNPLAIKMVYPVTSDGNYYKL